MLGIVKSGLVNIRSITLGINTEDRQNNNIVESISSFMIDSKKIFNDGGVDVRTTRMTMSPLNSHRNITRASARSTVGWISDLCTQVGIRWFCVPFDLSVPNIDSKTLLIANDVVTRFSNAFINLIVARDNVINHKGVSDAAKFIRTTSLLSNNGFDNFRVGVSCNCKPHTPFFPFSYHSGDDGFSIALETVDLFLDVIERKIGKGIDSVREELVELLSYELLRIEKLAKKIERETGLRYLGLDASLAPFPNGDSSVAKVIEMLGVEDFGSSSTLFFTSFLTNIIKNTIGSTKILNAGFNGVMFSLLEDDILALRAKQRNFNLDSLILYSSVCGCGVDMVPVPGDILVEEIAAITMDVAGLSLTLNKPLGLRVLPIPNKNKNEITNFNHDFLVDTRIMQIRDRSFTPEAFNQPEFNYLAEYGFRYKKNDH